VLLARSPVTVPVIATRLLVAAPGSSARVAVLVASLARVFVATARVVPVLVGLGLILASLGLGGGGARVGGSGCSGGPGVGGGRRSRVRADARRRRGAMIVFGVDAEVVGVFGRWLASLL
ncbi:hypothetical protein PENTCL1PPCAC_21912, partial [Pristionchus entomophagus]